MKHDLAEAKKDMAVLEKDNEVRLAQLHEATSGNMLRFVSYPLYGQSMQESRMAKNLKSCSLPNLSIRIFTSHAENRD